MYYPYGGYNVKRTKKEDGSYDVEYGPIINDDVDVLLVCVLGGPVLLAFAGVGISLFAFFWSWFNIDVLETALKITFFVSMGSLVLGIILFICGKVLDFVLDAKNKNKH